MEISYELVPQNDLVALQYVKDDYETDPAKGLTHGLQKDAIQNALGAAVNQKSLKNWKITFELLKIYNKDVICFVDEGTTGLTGDILTPSEINEKSANDDLGPNQNLARFLSLFESGGNIGPGSYGRGKLVFQACSKSKTILCDSFRKDGKYVSFKRTIKSNRLVQSQIFTDIEAKNFIKEQSEGVLEPLKKHGTRITIVDLDDEKQDNGLSIRESFLKSFENGIDDPECNQAFDKMIQETWWELLLKYNAQIEIKFNKQLKRVKILEPLKSILTKKDKEEKWRVYEAKENITISNKNYRIKKIRFVVAPTGIVIPENFREVSVQRKRMKIGKINRNIEPHNKIRKRFAGILELEPDLEEIMLEPENLTHYGYKSLQSSSVKQIRQSIRKHLDLFQEKLGITKKSSDEMLEKELKEVLKELNDKALELGLMTSIGSDKSKKNLSIRFKEFVLPHADSLRVEYADRVGPIVCEIRNHHSETFTGHIISKIIQQGNQHEQFLINRDIEILPSDISLIKIETFSVDSEFRYKEGILLKIEIPSQKVSNSRMLWLGREKPVIDPKYPINLEFDSPKFPRQKSRRIEIGESIKDINFSITNSIDRALSCNIALSIRRAHPENKLEILSLINEKELLLNPLTEKNFNYYEIQISKDKFQFFDKEPLNIESRKCEIYLKITSAEHHPDLRIGKGDYLTHRKMIPFYVGIDDPGLSIFQDTQNENDEEDPRRSWCRGNAGAGYIFHFNQGHPAFQRIKDLDESGELKKDYYKEEILKNAFIISLQNSNYKGIFQDLSKSAGETYEQVILTSDSNDETIVIFDELIGRALQSIYS
jgi:hypothetical protein